MPDLSSNPQHAELERRKHNLHKVYNPTDTDFKIVFNKAVAPEVWTVKANSEEILPEFVCKKYLRDMSNLIIFSKSDEKVKAENERRVKGGLQPMNLYSEQLMFESRNLKITEDQYVQMMGQLYRGLYQEYGIDAEPDMPGAETTSSKPVIESAMERIFSGEETVSNTLPKPPETTVPDKDDDINVPKNKPLKNDLKSKIDAEIKKVSKK